MRKSVLTLALVSLSAIAPLTTIAQMAAPKATPAAKPAAPATPAPATPAAAAAKTRPIPYQGKIDRVDKGSNTFTIKTKEGKEHVFNITDKTKIVKDNGAGTIDDLKKDLIVRGSRIKLGENKWEAVKVTIGAKPEKAE